MVKLEDIGDLLGSLQGVSALDKMADTSVGATDSLGNLINVLRLDNSLEIVLQKLGEVV
jgi:hypothetical protein